MAMVRERIGPEMGRGGDMTDSDRAMICALTCYVLAIMFMGAVGMR